MPRRFVPVLLSLALLAPIPVGAEEAAADSSAAGTWEVAHSEVGPTHPLTWTVEEGTWMCVDVSPDGRTIVFDLLGDIYTMPIEGGTARPLRTGRAWEIQPRFSPDGAWISFTSDAGGGDNVWVMRADGGDARAVTDEDFRLLNNADWTADGRFLVARKHFTSRRSLGAGEMWLYDVTHGGAGVQLTDKPSDQKDVNDPTLSTDGRYLYYSLDVSPGPRFEYNKDPNGVIYAIRRLDLLTGETETVVRETGGGVRPQISPDGDHLAYVRRVRGQSWLVVRDLRTGEDTPVFDGLYRDQQETWAIFGPYPGFDWTPDGREIVVWGAGGKLYRVDVAARRAREIPFRVEVTQDVVEAVRFAQDIGGDTFPVRVVRWPRISPDGQRVVFQAVGHLWIRDLEGGEPRRLTRDEDFEFHPAWSADGQRVVYTTWDDVEGGRVRTIGAGGGSPRTLVDRPGHYAEPSFSDDGRWVVYRRGGGDGYRGSLWATDTGVYVVESKGGESRRVTESGSRPRFDRSGQRIWLLENGEKTTLYHVDRLGGDRTEVATSERAMEMLPSPDGRWLAFTELWEVYVCPMPAAGRALAVGPNMKALPVRKVSKVSGEFLQWSADSRRLRFGLGPDLFEAEVERFFAPKAEGEDGPEARRFPLGFAHAADVPPTDLAFVNATVLTMDGDRVIEDGVVRVRGSRIVGVGREGEVDVAGAEIVDLRGRVLMPGFIDTHAHMGSSNLGMHARRNWAYLANLAFGVTTTHDPSKNTSMVFASHELVEAGELLGPRIFSTGTILYGAEGDFKAVTESREDARRHLERLKAYGAFSVKSYNQPRRDQRQWILREARDLGMMVMPEGGSTMHHNLTQFLDGHTTLEHALPLTPLYEDVLHFISNTRTAYTPTLVVGYGGIWGENYWYQKTEVWRNERLLRFVPREGVDARSRRRFMAPDEEFHHDDIAAGAAEMVRRGGLATVGAHGQIQGLGVHWETWMFEQGGLTPMECLQVATRMGAEALGLDGHLGTVEEGKLADLIVLAADPRENLRHTERVDMVMSDGRLYEAPSLRQLHPERRELPAGPALETLFDPGPGCGCQRGHGHP